MKLKDGSYYLEQKVTLNIKVETNLLFVELKHFFVIRNQTQNTPYPGYSTLIIEPCPGEEVPSIVF